MDMMKYLNPKTKEGMAVIAVIVIVLVFLGLYFGGILKF
jgi:hypothetical protein